MMAIISSIVSVYLLIGVLVMIFTVLMAKKHRLVITAEMVLLGILVWFFSLPEIFRLIWSTLKLAYWEEKMKWDYRQMVKQKSKLDRLMEKLEKEMK